MKSTQSIAILRETVLEDLYNAVYIDGKEIFRQSKQKFRNRVTICQEFL